MSSSTNDPGAGRAGAEAGREPGLHVVATAGHVDHGKSSLILRLTGMDPDRWAEEKLRGLTIDLGYAWCELPSGREIAFVDVPGHERFIRNMLAGLGPVRRVLFVVAADEGWKPQSEEHLAIVTLLGATGVVGLTKADVVDAGRLKLVREEIRERLAGTSMEGASILACSSETGAGLDELRAALDELTAAPVIGPGSDRPRLFVDRVFSIRGAGTVVTGTLTGGCLGVGDEVTVLPDGLRARIRGLQSHKRMVETACPVSRVAMNLVGIEREELERGDVIARPGDWRSTRAFEARIRPVRGLDHPLTARGAFKVYAGSAEVDARLRLLGTSSLEPGSVAYARIRTSRPLALDLFDEIVLREAGRRETVAGGQVIDIDPPARPGGDAVARLERRRSAPRSALPALLASERGAVRTREALVLTGVTPPTEASVEGGAVAETLPEPTAAVAGDWLLDPQLEVRVQDEIAGALAAFHDEHPLREGANLGTIRTRVADLLAASGAPAGADLVDALLDSLVEREVLARSATTVRLATHEVSLAESQEDLSELLDALERGEPMPPTVEELAGGGISREVIEAGVRAGSLVRVSTEFALRPEFVAEAEHAIGALAAEGTPITVSAFRELLGTSRKYAVPLLEHFDAVGLTRREGDIRVLRQR